MLTPKADLDVTGVDVTGGSEHIYLAICLFNSHTPIRDVIERNSIVRGEKKKTITNLPITCLVPVQSVEKEA